MAEKIFTKNDRPQDLEGEFVIPEGFTEIGEEAFYGCEELTSVIIPDTVTKIGNCAFAECYSLTDIVLPNSLKCIDEQGFYNCSSLTSITIPDSVTEIGYYAFAECDSLTQFVCSANLALNKGMFGSEEALKRIKSGASGNASNKDKEDSSYSYSFDDVTRTAPAYERSNARSKDKLTKANLVWDVFNTLAQEVKTDITLNELSENFAFHGNEKSSVRTVIAEGDYAGLSDNNKKRYFSEPIKVSDGAFYLSNQWGAGNIGDLIEAIGEYGIKVEQASNSGSEGKHTVHVQFGTNAYYRWSAQSINKEELMEFLSGHSDEEIDLDSDEGVESASEIIKENLYDFCDAFECHPDKGDLWGEDTMTLTVEDGDIESEFSKDELKDAASASEEEGSVSQDDDEILVVVEVTAKAPVYEADIEIEGEFDESKLSVVDHVYELSGDTLAYQDFQYDGEDICLELTYDRVIEEKVTLKNA